MCTDWQVRGQHRRDIGRTTKQVESGLLVRPQRMKGRKAKYPFVYLGCNYCFRNRTQHANKLLFARRRPQFDRKAGWYLKRTSRLASVSEANASKA